MTGMAGHDPGISGHVRPESLVTLLRNTHAVEVASKADLVPTLELIKQAVEAGELDAQIAVASEKLRDGFVK